MNEKQIRELADRAVAYLNSEEGRNRLRAANKEAARLSDQFRKMRQVPHELLHRPFTI